MTPTKKPGVSTIASILRRGEAMLAEHGIPNARRNAEWLLCDTLACSMLELYTPSDRALSDGEAGDYWDRIRRRSAREPLQYILGRTEFMSLTFETPAGVFVPRPDTEILVELAEARLRRVPLDRQIDVLDLCCGSGVIAVSLAARIPNIKVVAVDASGLAVSTTMTNASRNGVGERVSVVESEAGKFMESIPDRAYAAIVCNPPYIESGELTSLPPEVRNHEPRGALDGGRDGLEFYRSVAPSLSRRLRPGGFVAFEIGDGHGAAVAGILRESGLADVSVTSDYAGRPRVVVAGQPE
jgi:release factor glutamine methyltransferase